MEKSLKTLLFLILVISTLWGARSASAAGEEAVLILFPPPDFAVGDEISFSLGLTTLKGNPLYAQPVDFFLDGEYLETIETGPQGSIRLRLPRLLPAGTYVLEAFYAGYQFEVTAPLVVPFEVSPVEIVITTVPVIAGLELALDGELIRTGPDGIVRVPVREAGVYGLELLPNEDLLAAENAEFVQWFPANFTRQTDITIPGQERLDVGFEQKFDARFEFVDPDGNPVPGGRVTEILLRSSNGDVVQLTNAGPETLVANRILARLSGLDSTTVVHRVQQVLIDGSNVVNRGQQSFIYSPGRPVRIELLLHDVHFIAEDLVFGIPFGKGVFLTFPDGSEHYFPYESPGGITLIRLARGSYEARVEVDQGITFPLPLVVTRDQEVRVPVISFYDLMLGASLAMGLIVGLPTWGRRRAIVNLLFRRRPAGQDAP